MGTDLIPTLHEWDNAPQFMQEHSFVLQSRQGYELPNLEEHPNFPKKCQLMTSETVGMMSSTEVRKRLRHSHATGSKINVHGHVTPNTIKYLLENNLYI